MFALFAIYRNWVFMNKPVTNFTARCIRQCIPYINLTFTTCIKVFFCWTKILINCFDFSIIKTVSRDNFFYGFIYCFIHCYSNRQGGLGIVKVSFLEQAIAVSRGREENASLELDFSSVLTALATAITSVRIKDTWKSRYSASHWFIYTNRRNRYSPFPPTPFPTLTGNFRSRTDVKQMQYGPHKLVK